MHISENQVEGSLEDTSVGELLDACHRALLTGTIKISAGKVEALLELRAGAVDAVDFRGMSKSDAVAELRNLKSGSFELTQRLPSLSGELGSSARLEGSDSDVSLIELMQHCEENALSCTIVVVSGFDRAEIHYRVGEIDDVVFNGKSDPDKIVDIVRFEDARFRVTPPPLNLGILTWPVVRKDPTPPFTPLANPNGEPERAARKAEAEAETETEAEAGAEAGAETGAETEAEAEAKTGGAVDEDEYYEDDYYEDEYEDEEPAEAKPAEAAQPRAADSGKRRKPEPPAKPISPIWILLIAVVVAVVGFVIYQLYLSLGS